ncbi:MAG: glycine--tRNA ligase subunit beta, partial [Rhodoferax sp.]|nr:glycine--tRNA ligase subunit beta [Rhodoferax sp.]
MTTENLLVELFVEELPPKALRALGEAFGAEMLSQLRALGLAGEDAVLSCYASPRRLAAHVTRVSRKAADRPTRQKLMPVSVGLDAAGQPTPALLKKLQALEVDVSDPAAAVAALRRAPDGKGEALFLDGWVTGAALDQGLQRALDEALARLPIPKLMSYQLEQDCELPGWSSVHFVRPAHGLLALHGPDVVPVRALGLRAGRQTQGHRFEASVSPLVLAAADDYAAAMERDGAVIPAFEARRSEIVRQLQQAAEGLGPAYRVLMDDALLDEVTGLVERPNVLVCAFDESFLEVPQECLILTMKANQKYFPMVDGAGRLTHRFLMVSNIRPADPSAVIGGNERVVRPRLADAQFFFNQDRKRSLASRLPGLDKVVYHNRLGSQGERTQRVCAIARMLAMDMGGEALAAQAEAAARLAKADLLTDMVGEFPELQGVMGGYYARHDGLGEEIACAIEDHYKPRFAGDRLARNPVGLAVALADKLETLVGMFGIGNLPTGDKDPYALRRHALGVIRMLIECDLPLPLDATLDRVAAVFGSLIAPARPALSEFIEDRLAGTLREQGYSAQEVESVLALRPQRLGEVPR